MRPLRAAAWLGGLLGAGALLHLAGTGDLAAPPLDSPAGVVDWVDAREPATAALALVRLLAELAVWYVLGVSALHVLAGALHRRGAHRVADTLAVPAVARMIRAGLGVGLAAAATLQPAVAGASGRVGTIAMDTESRTPTTTAVMAPATGTATMQPSPMPAPSPAPAPVTPPAPTAAPPTAWAVSAGESFWTIAEEVLGEAWARTPTDAEVDPYWRQLVERNRARLADPDDPSLLHPGQVLELPPIP